MNPQRLGLPLRQGLHQAALRPGSALPPDAISYTADYLRRFEAAPPAAISAALVAAMKSAYPQAGLESALQLSAKVANGELAW
ncbi:MAG TPA: hypothetical protein VGD52_24560 [Pseudoduganella sp.]